MSGCATPTRSTRSRLSRLRHSRCSRRQARPRRRSSAIRFVYNTLDDPIKPTKGWAVSFSQEFAGLGGSLKYLRTQGSVGYYHPMLLGLDRSARSICRSGYITGYDGQTIPIQERFFKGGDSFRGFAQAGVGPRDTVVAGNQRRGRRQCLRHRQRADAAAQLPARQLWRESGSVQRFRHGRPSRHVPFRACTLTSCIKDNLAIRASAGLAVAWKSPFGPITIDLGVPFLKTTYDKPQIIYFSAGTGL